jgi:NADPH:quinone reductase-like Zn-dependent oxidoreductase
MACRTYNGSNRAHGDLAGRWIDLPSSMEPQTMGSGNGVRPTAGRLELKPGERPMMAVVTTGNGGYETLVYRQVPIPRPADGEALLQVLAAGINNTEINTRVGWYSSSVTTDTEAAVEAQQLRAAAKADGGWREPTPFPFIQGTDCCGRVAAVGREVDEKLIGRRALVRPCMRIGGFSSLDSIWLGSDFDGAFAEFVKVPASEVFPIDCDWSDAELGTIPCAYGTAENMLHRAKVGQGEHVLVTGASGGVGSATVRLAKRRGATVTAVAARSKHAAVLAIGADRVLDRNDDPVTALGKASVDVVVDNVAGAGFGKVVRAIKRGGRYASSGAIAGPLVTLDMRDVYLNDLTLFGCTAWDEPVFPNLIAYIERGELTPLPVQAFSLDRIADAQRLFLEKTHVGKLVLIPPRPGV